MPGQSSFPCHFTSYLSNTTMKVEPPCKFRVIKVTYKQSRNLIKRLMNIFAPPDQRHNPFEFYASMRRLNPVVYDERNNVWGVFRYTDVQSILADYRTFSSAPQKLDSPSLSASEPNKNTTACRFPAPKLASIRSTIS